MTASLFVALPAVLAPLLAAPDDPSPFPLITATSREFRWTPTAADLGEVQAARGTEWSAASGGDFLVRAVPSWTGDPTYELVFPAPGSGHPELAERLLVQVPEDFLERPHAERAALIAFHSFGASEKEIFLSSDLASECRRRHWLLIAPYGLTEVNFASAQSQASLAVVLAKLRESIPFHDRRLYAAGFSMGGVNALSFAMRQQDPRGLRVAGVVFHSGVLDVARVHADGDLWTRALLEHPHHFGGTPDEVPFEYARVSPVRFLRSGLVDPDHAPVVHLHDVPIFLHANLADPNTELVEGVLELERFLLARGADVHQSYVFDPDAGHAWTTLPTADALATIGASALGGAPTTMEVFADQPVPYGAVEVHDPSRDTHARFLVELTPQGLADNSFALTRTQDVDVLAIAPRAARLDPSRPVTFRWSSLDGTGDRLVLQGYQRLPSRVTFDGATPPPRTWWWNEPLEQIVIDLPRGGEPVVVVVRP